jgi:DNA-nicking Smr family endonuclease
MKEKKEQRAVPANSDLFQQALDGVIPLPPSDRVSPAQPGHRVPSPDKPLLTGAIADTFSDNETGDEVPTEFLRSGISRKTLRNLRRGRWPMQDTLDLHGFNSDGARKMLLEFLNEAMRNGLRSVCVIHGKGWQPGGKEGVLKGRVRHWLAQYPEVLAFCEAPQNAGGGGAVWVLLKAGGHDDDIYE